MENFGESKNFKELEDKFAKMNMLHIISYHSINECTIFYNTKLKVSYSTDVYRNT